MSLTFKERDNDPEFTYRLLVLTLVIDSVVGGLLFWHAYNRPATDFPLASIQMKTLSGSFFYTILPLVAWWLLRQEQPVVSLFYAFVKLICTLLVSAQIQGHTFIGQTPSWRAYAQVGWSSFTVVIATIYFFSKFTFNPSNTNISSPKATLVEQIEELQVLRANGTLSEERFKEIEANLIARAKEE